MELEALTNCLTYQLTESALQTPIEDALNKYWHVYLMLQSTVDITYTTDIFVSW